MFHKAPPVEFDSDLVLVWIYYVIKNGDYTYSPLQKSVESDIIKRGGVIVKINSIKLNCRQRIPDENYGSDTVLFVFRTPVIMKTGDKEIKAAGYTAMVSTSGYRRSFLPAEGGKLVYDYISFRSSAADRQYAASINLPLDVPVELKEPMTVAALMRNIKSRSLYKGKYRSEFMELAMRLIFLAISDDPGRQTVSGGEDIPRYNELKALRDAIYDDPVNQWSTDEICSEMGISHTYFHRLYLKAFGVTCRQDVIESRLMYAAELLKSTDMPITEIAVECGYDSESYFMRQFKQHKGCTPTEFRRRNTE